MPLAVNHNQSSVLAFSSDVSNTGLLAATNLARGEASKSPLLLSASLSKSAQAKAEDMVKNDYWSHESPDGTQPWRFFESAGYEYIRAGENLAYGFDSSSSTIKAWMQSPSHRQNVLGEYSEVGFGMASGNHYQGGRYTVIVAHYAVPATKEVATVSGQTAAAATPPAAITTSASAGIANWNQLLSGHLPLLATISLSLCAGAALMFAYTHRQLMLHAVASGEKFAATHPLVDASLVTAAVILILTAQRAVIG